MNRYLAGAILILLTVTSCEEVIEIGLNYNESAFAIEGIIARDSVCIVRLTLTGDYFSDDDAIPVEDAAITISNGTITESLSYSGNGYFRGSSITGEEEVTYYLEVTYNGNIYQARSYMPVQKSILSVNYTRSDERSSVNPLGETVFTISCSFRDIPDRDDYYMIKYTEDGRMIESKYFLLTESRANGGSLEYNSSGYLRFSESIFYDGGEIEVQLFSIDEGVYNYFMQLNDILFWQRRVIPPTPYNPISNISGGALGYFAAWGIDTRTIFLE